MKKANPVGRPRDYNESILKLAIEYCDTKRPTEDEVIPTIEGLALHLHISRSTVYEWIKDKSKKEFSDTVEEILAKQGKTLQNSGLTNKFSSVITKLLLSANHGMREKTDITSDDKQIDAIKIEIVDGTKS